MMFNVLRFCVHFANNFANHSLSVMILVKGELGNLYIYIYIYIYIYNNNSMILKITNKQTKNKESVMQNEMHYSKRYAPSK